MSYDRAINQLCPHLVVDEYLLFGSTRDRVYPMRPISSAGSVKVRLNGLMDVPSYGVATPATSGGSKEGPYNIKYGVNDLLKLRVGAGDWQVCRLPAGAKTSVDQTASILSRSFSGVNFFVNPNNPHLIGFSTNEVGSGASLYIHKDSTLAVGFKADRIYRGVDITPGWSLVNDPNTLSDRPSRLIVFDDYLDAANNFIEVSYTTVRQECRRCGGLGVENDWRYLSGGDVTVVTDSDLLIQEIQKIMFTIRYSNPFHTGYGTTIVDQIGQKLTMGGLIQNRIVAEVNATFTKWQKIKKQQEEIVGQLVTDEEFPYRLQSVTLDQSQTDPTVVFVNIEIMSRSTKPILITRGLRVPMPEDLLGSTQQSSIIRNLQSNTLVG